jgi:hypothetical protein
MASGRPPPSNTASTSNDGAQKAAHPGRQHQSPTVEASAMAEQQQHSADAQENQDTCESDDGNADAHEYWPRGSSNFAHSYEDDEAQFVLPTLAACDDTAPADDDGGDGEDGDQTEDHDESNYVGIPIHFIYSTLS